MLNNSLKMAVLAGGLLVPGIAAAAAPAIATTDLNFRTGPSTAYPAFDVIPEGGDVTVYGCLGGYGWCDIEWAGYRGWVSGDYLAYLGERYYRRPISSIGISIGLPVIGYDRYDYYDRWYDDDYFDRWIRREIREDRREHRQEVRQERREDRRELKQDRREDRREARQDRRQENRQADRQRERQQEQADRQQRQQEQADRQERQREKAARQQERQQKQAARQERKDRASREETREKRRAARKETREERRDARQARPEGNAATLEEWRREQFRNR